MGEWTGDSIAVLEAHYANLLPDEERSLDFVVPVPSVRPGRRGDRAFKLRFRSTSEYGALCQVPSGASGGASWNAPPA